MFGVMVRLDERGGILVRVVVVFGYPGGASHRFFLSLDVSGSEIWYGSFLARKGKEGVN